MAEFLVQHALLGLGLPGNERVVLGLKLGAGRMIVGLRAREQVGELLGAVGDMPCRKSDVAAARAFPVHVSLQLVRGLSRDGVCAEGEIERVSERRVVPHQQMPAFIEGGDEMHEENELSEVLQAGQRENPVLIKVGQVVAMIVARLVYVGRARSEMADR